MTIFSTGLYDLEEKRKDFMNDSITKMDFVKMVDGSSVIRVIVEDADEFCKFYKKHPNAKPEMIRKKVATVYQSWLDTLWGK
jgi:hypothetical protein